MDDDQNDDIETIQPDIERPMTERERMMEQIASSRMEELGAEDGVASEEIQADDDENAARVEADSVDDDQIAIQDQQKVFDGDPDQTLVRLKINGEEHDVPLARLIADAQKHEAADKRLAEASRLLREARSQSSQKETMTQASEHDALAEARSFVDALFGSNEEEATQALLKIIQRPSENRTAEIDADAIAERVEAQLDRKSALRRFMQDHPYVEQDPDLDVLAGNKLSRRLEAGESFSEALSAVGEEMRKFAPKQDVKAEAPATTSRQQILEDKRSRDHVRGQSHSAATTEPPQLTPSQVIAEIQAQRQRGNWKPH